jgi:hypothetical protein
LASGFPFFYKFGSFHGTEKHIIACAKSRGALNFRCTWWTKDGGWFAFTAKQLKQIAELGLDLEFEIAAYPDDKDSEIDDSL